MLLREYWLNRLALLCSFFGIALLLAYSYLDAPEELSIEEIGHHKLGAKVRVKGIVYFSKSGENFIIFGLNDGAKIKCIYFNPEIRERIIIRKGNLIEVIGKIKLYKGNLEIVAEKVNLLD